MTRLIIEHLGADEIASGLFLRDGSGRLTFVSRSGRTDSTKMAAVGAMISSAMPNYVDELPLATPDDLFDDELKDKSIGQFQSIEISGKVFPIRYLDRRVVGSDWQRNAASQEAPRETPNLFFVSLKGGVGRSTALCVLAAHLASSGKRVLAIDLDLEAPGLGSMLLDEETFPRFGVLDYLVERRMGCIDRAFITDMISPSGLLSGMGRIDVIPAMGAECRDNPDNVLSKLARAYLVDSSVDGKVSTFTDAISELISNLTEDNSYDVVLIDARAGLHETTASSLFVLPGKTLLFGINQPQTFFGYSIIFSQMAAALGSVWAERLCIVEAKASLGRKTDDFARKVSECAPEFKVGVDQPIDPSELKDVFDLSWEDSEAAEVDLPDEPLALHTYITNSDHFLDFDPIKNPDLLTEGIYKAVYEDFLETCEAILWNSQSNGCDT